MALLSTISVSDIPGLYVLQRCSFQKEVLMPYQRSVTGCFWSLVGWAHQFCAVHCFSYVTGLHSFQARRFVICPSMAHPYNAYGIAVRS